MKNRQIHCGGISHPRFRVDMTFETPDGQTLGSLTQSGIIDYARGDWERFDELPAELKQQILDELREVLVEEVL